ncbi:MAG: FG-GAP repeat protein [Myxococcales bacterium]|nr:FG-GAP repeat protein [Myxococcales bacterium]
MDDAIANVGPTWLFHLPARDNTGGIDSSSNPHLDVNGDGFDDLIIGAIKTAPGGRRNAGTASVFHGSAAGIADTAARTLEGLAEGDGLGFSVASAGDVNGDGFADIVVAAPGADPGGRLDAGTVSVYLGGATGIDSPARALEGPAAGSLLGVSVASAGDVNGDGFADIVVGAGGGAPGGRLTAGTATVFHGSASGIAEAPARVLEGAAVGDRFGGSVASAGDVNGDGFSDIVVGARSASPRAFGAPGTASVFHGSATGIEETAARTLEGVGLFDSFGASVASAGDVNGDGFSDVVVGAPRASSSRFEAGAASVFHGSATGIEATATRVFEGVAANDQFGEAVSGAGDVNGDGFADIIVGAPLVRRNNRLGGIVSVVHGSATGIATTAARTLDGVGELDAFGWSIARAGDVNGDGFADIVVGAHLAAPGDRVAAGRASVFHGSATGIAPTSARTFEGVDADTWFGYSVASADDVDAADRQANACTLARGRPTRRIAQRPSISTPVKRLTLTVASPER